MARGLGRRRGRITRGVTPLLLLLLLLIGLPCFTSATPEYDEEEDFQSTTEDIPETDETEETDATDEVTDVPTVQPTEDPEMDELELYKKTKVELQKTSRTLKNFRNLIEEEEEKEAEDMSEKMNSNPILAMLLKQIDMKEESEDPNEGICKQGTDGALCNELLLNLNQTMELVNKAKKPEEWIPKDLEALKMRNAELSSFYTIVSEDEDLTQEFLDSIADMDALRKAIDDANEAVNDAIDETQKKIDDIERERSGSVVLVAVVGSIGGVMVVSVLGTMTYTAVQKKKKNKKRSDPTQYDKLQGENIPIEGFLSDTQPHQPRPSTSSRLSPYTPQQPHPRGDPYTNQGFQSDSDYRPVIIPRVGQGLPRTQHY